MSGKSPSQPANVSTIASRKRIGITPPPFSLERKLDKS
jgi:hypothetical protein